MAAKLKADKAKLLAEQNLTESLIKEKCSDDHIGEIQQFISWDTVGPHLSQITRQDVGDIKLDGHDQESRRGLLLNMWETRNGDDANYDDMIKAMLKARKKAEATKVCQLLKPEEGTADTAVTPAKPRNQRGPGGGPIGPRGTTLADSPGIAILVTCDYQKSTSHLSTLPGTNNDATEIKKTFDFFNYLVFQLQNEQACKKDIETLLMKVSNDLKKYDGESENKVIMFAFSGHGTNEDESEQIFAYDGKTLDIKDEIVLPLTRHKAVANIPKLFFIDACRGDMSLVSKGASGGGEADTTTKSASDEQYFEKGVQHVEGNYRIDYATIPQHVSYGTKTESLWLPKLARALREENDSFQNIADNVKKQVHDQLGNKKQQCESVNRLNTGALYLQK